MISTASDLRFSVLETGPDAAREDFADAVRAGLQARPRHLPCRYIYDARGSALFERICQLPSYYPPAAEHQIIERHADEIVSLCAQPCELIELGSGSAEKTDPLIRALCQRQGEVRYYPIDVSRSALEDSARRMFADYDRLTIRALLGDYDSALARLPAEGPGRLFAWLGSSIGNLDRQRAAQFLSRLPLREQDRAFVGIDLRKPRATLERAYDDPEGVTAEFIANVLVRVNRELAGDFDLSAFAYRANYDEDAGRVVMSLSSRRAQRVRIAALRMTVALEEGEAIHVEDSYKYSEEEIEELAAAAGLRLLRRFFDDQRRFCSVLLAPAGAVQGEAR